MAKLKDLKVTIGLSKKGMMKLNADLRRTRNNFRRNFGEIASLAKNAALAIGTTLVAGITALVKAGADMERLTIGFRSITGSAEGAAKMVARLNEFAATTPFQLENISRAARQLLATGSKESDLTKELRMLGDIAAASGNQIEDIAAIFAKVRAKGKVELENLNQLAERGIPIFDQLRMVTGDANMQFGAGAVSVRDFTKALEQMTEEGGFAEDSMQQLSETTYGLASTLTDKAMIAASQFSEESGLMGQVNKYLTRALGIVDREIKTTSADVEILSDRFKELTDKALNPTSQNIEELETGFGDLKKSLEIAFAKAKLGSKEWQTTFAMIHQVEDAIVELNKAVLDGLEPGEDLTAVFKAYNDEGLKATRISELLTDNQEEQIVSAKELKDAYADLAGLYNKVAVDMSNMEAVAMDEEVLDEESQDRIAHGTKLINKAQFAAEKMGNAFTITSGMVNAAFENMRDKSQGFHLYLKQVLLDLLKRAIALATAFAAMSIFMGPAAMAKTGGFKKFMAAGMGFGGAIPQMAEGGLFTGASLAQVGEGPGTSMINPEVVAPLDKLKSMMGGGHVTVTGRLDGRDILISSERAGFDRNRVRGF